MEFVGKMSELYPKDNFKAAKVVEALCAMEDLGYELATSFREQDPEKKKALRLVLAEKSIPEFSQKLEKFLVATSDGPFVLGQEISIADLVVGRQVKYLSSGILDHIPKEVLSAYPRLNKLSQAMYEHPKVKEFYANKAAKKQ